MKIHLDWIGCRLNQSEMELMAAQFHKHGHELVDSAVECDLVVINTCAVTAAAASDSRNLARKVARMNPKADIVLTGCWSELNPDQALTLDGVNRVIMNGKKSDLVQILLNQSIESDARIDRITLPGRKNRTRAHIKVQDGCDFSCNYCVTTIARGPARSIREETVLERVNAAIAAGTKEIVLCGVALSSYGRDCDPRISLADLVASILKKTTIQRLRLSSIEPWGIEERLFDLWKDPRFCPSLHLPLQTGCDRTLRRMQRPSSQENYARVVQIARNHEPNLGLTTDILVGFPGETDDEFEQSLRFIQRMKFSGGHVFSYSPRPGTPSADLADQVAPKIRKIRSQMVQELLKESKTAFIKGNIDSEVQVLWERAKVQKNGTLIHRGLTNNGIRVITQSESNLQNKITNVKITGFRDTDLFGIVREISPGWVRFGTHPQLKGMKAIPLS